jgi:hypothetical protein
VPGPMSPVQGSNVFTISSKSPLVCSEEILRTQCTAVVGR